MNSQRHFSDIRVKQKANAWQAILAFLKHPRIVNLRPTFYRRYPAIVLLAVVLLGLVTFTARKIFTRAQVADFFPGSCLGTWENPVRAQGEPETLSDAAAPLDEKVAAVFNGGDEQIFCGSFVPDSFEAKGELKNVSLLLAWRMEGAAPEPIHENPISTSSEPSVTPIEPSTSTPTDASSSAMRISPWMSWLPVASAQEENPEASPVIEPEPQPEPVPAAEETSSEPSEPAPVIVAPPLQADLTDNASSTPYPTETTSTQENVGFTPEPVLSAPAPDERYLSVKYSFDGQSWVELQKVGVENWQNFTIEMPVKTWDELKKVQIRIEGVATSLAHIRKMYLDGMVLEAHYEEAPILNSDQITPLSQESRVIQVDEHTTIEIPADETPNLVPPPEIIHFRKTGNDFTVTVRFVGEFYGGNPMNVFVYPAATTAKRNSADNAFTFAEEPKEGLFLDAIQLSQADFNKEKEINLPLISPGIQEGSGLDPRRMIPGKYAIDIAYFDGKTWHKTSPQYFDWP